MILKKIFSVFSLQFLASLSSFILGVLTAKYFGISDRMDALLATTTFVTTLNILISKAHSKALIPFLVEKEKNKDETLKSILYFNLIVFSLLALLIFIAAYPLSIAIAPGLKGDQHQVMAIVLRIMSMYFFLANFRSIFVSILRFELKFNTIAIVQLLGSLITLGLVLSFGKSYGPIFIAWAHTISILVVTTILFCFHKNYFTLDLFKRPVLSHISKQYNMLIIPILIGSFLMWLIKFSDSFIASFLDAGSISLQNYALRVIRQPEVLTTVICSIYFPILSKTVNITKYLKTFYEGLDLLFTITCAIVGVFFLEVESIVSILFERGEFTSRNTIAVANILRFYIPLIICAPMGTYLNNVFYSKKEVKLAMKYSLISSVINIVLNIVFAPFWGVKGLAVASSVGYIAGNILQGVNICKVLPGYSFSVFLKRFLHSFTPLISSLFLSMKVQSFLTVNTIWIKMATEVAIFGLFYGVLCLLMGNRLVLRGGRRALQFIGYRK